MFIWICNSDIVSTMNNFNDFLQKINSEFYIYPIKDDLSTFLLISSEVYIFILNNFKNDCCLKLEQYYILQIHKIQ